MSCDWVRVPLSSLGKIVTGKTPPSKVTDAFVNGNVPFVTPRDLDDRKWIKTTERYLSNTGLESVKGNIVPAHSVAVSCIGSDMGKARLLSVKSVTNQQINTILVNSELHNPEYIYYVLSTKQQSLKDIAGGSATPILNKSHFGQFEIDLPSKGYQDAVVDVLRGLDSKIEINTQTNETLEEMAQAIFKSWFVDFEPVKAKMNGEQPEGMDAATASLFPEKLVESELGLIPEGWTVKPFKKVIDKYVDNRGKTPPVVEDGIPLVEVKHLPENSAFPNLNTDKRVTEETFNTWFRVHVEPKDVLISTVGTIGRTSFVKNTNFGIAQNVLGLRFGKVVEPEYMFYTIKAHRFQHDMDARLVTTVQSSIKRKDLDTIDILVPPSNVQKEFCKLVSSLLDGQYSKNAENIELASLRDTLLPKLLSGEIELGVAEAITND